MEMNPIRIHDCTFPSWILSMGITGLDLNNVRAAAKLRPKIFRSHAVSLPSTDRAVNEQGEIVVSKIKQEQKRLSDDEVSLIIAAYKSGSSTYDLAEQFGCHRNTISNAIKSRGVSVTIRKDEKLDAEDVIAMYENMHTSAEIAEKYGVGPNIICRLLRSHGVKIRGRWDY